MQFFRAAARVMKFWWDGKTQQWKENKKKKNVPMTTIETERTQKVRRKTVVTLWKVSLIFIATFDFLDHFEITSVFVTFWRLLFFKIKNCEVHFVFNLYESWENGVLYHEKVKKPRSGKRYAASRNSRILVKRKNVEHFWILFFSVEGFCFCFYFC